MPYVPRLTDPSYSDKHWIHTSAGGYNPCIRINGGSVLPNCFSGDTRIITKGGIVRLDSIVDKEVEVLSQGDVYRKAVGHKYGFQRVYMICFSSGDQYVCTANHRWVVKQKDSYVIKKTLELTQFDLIPYADSERTTSMSCVVYLGYKVEVFCVEEPETHTFALDSGILTGNCVGYAWGRFCEIMGTTTCKLSRADAGKWIGYTEDGYARGTTPMLGAVICWRKPGDCGHVAIVEKINSDGSIVTSNSAYGGKRFYTQTLQAPQYWMDRRHRYLFQGFIYNPAVGEFGNMVPTDGSIGYGTYGPIYTTESTREDATIREVGYITPAGEPTLKPSAVKLSVINYTTLLGSIMNTLILPNLYSSTFGYNVILDNIPEQNARVIIKYLLDKGLSAAGAIGIAANIKAECGYDCSLSGDYQGKVPTSFGICQWHNERGAAMKIVVGDNWQNNMTGQLNFLWDDMETSFSDMLNRIRAVENTESGARSAADIFVRTYERPAGIDAASAKRQDYASELWGLIALQPVASADSSMVSRLDENGQLSGKEISIPSTVNQAGITGNYSNYSYLYKKWGKSSVQRKIADLWNRKGRMGNRNIATLDGYYLCATTLLFGTTGDKISIVLEDGTVINAILGDSKGDNPALHGEQGNIYGHAFGGSGKIDIIEWEAIGPDTKSTINYPVDISGWKGKKVAKIINGGSYL